jgi:hypothetical protein
MADVTVNITAQDNFSGVLGNFGSIITGIESAVRLAGDAFRGLVDFGSQFVDSAIEGQNAVAELEQVLKATGGAAGLTSQELQDMASSLQGVTAFSDETIMSGQAMLLTFRNIGEDTFPRATEAMLDMGAMFGNVDTAAVQLGKALNDPIAGIGALSRIGIQFTEEQKEMIKNFMETGDVAAAQNIILKEVEMQIGGLAEAMGETFAGKMEILKNRFDEVKETIGLALLPILEQLMDRFTDFMPSIEAIGGRIAEVFDAIADAGLGSTEMWEALGGLFDEIFGIFEDGSSRIGAFFEMLGMSEDDANALALSIDGIKDKVLEAVDAWKAEGFTGLVDFLLGEIDTQAIASWLDELDAKIAIAVEAKDWTTSGSAFGDMIAKLFEGDGGLESAESKAVPAIAQAIGDWFLAAAGVADWNEFSNTFADILQYYLIELPFSKISTALTTPWIYELAHSIGEGLLVGLNSIDLKANEWFDRVFVQPIKEFLGIASPSTLFMGIGRDIVLGLIVGWVGMFSGFSAIVSGAMNSIVGTITGIFTTLWGNLIVIFNKIIDAWNTSGLAGIIALIGGGSLFPGGTGGASGSSDLGGGTPSTGASGTTVNQYFAGATINVGSWDEIIYDCVYPNPFIGSTSGQLTGGGGGGTGAPR